MSGSGAGALSLFDYDEQTRMAELVHPAESAPAPSGWPEDGLRPHPFAGINRMMTAEEFGELKADVEAHGLLERIVIFEGKILDGRNRYLAGIAAGRFVPNVAWETHRDFVEFGDRGTEALAFVWGMEVRRHRSAKDTALAAARYLRFIADFKPADPDGKTAKLRLPTQAELAKRHGISERLVNAALALLERAEPEVVAAVEDGRMALADAADVVSRLDPVEQRIIAENPDRKSTKAAVKEKKTTAASQPLPELPSPVSRVDLAEFADDVLHLAAGARQRHGGKAGASISADAILDFGRKLGLMERGEEFALSRPMLLVLGKLREDAPKLGAGKDEPDEPDQPGRFGVSATLPEPPPLGQGVTYDVPVLGKEFSAGIGVYHEADGYSVMAGHEFATSSSGGPYMGQYASFAAAFVAAGSRLHWVLARIAASVTSVTTAAEKAAAQAGVEWIEAVFSDWGLEVEDFELDLSLESDPPETASGGAEAAAPAGGEGGVTASLPTTIAAGRPYTRASAEAVLRAHYASAPGTELAEAMGLPVNTLRNWGHHYGLTSQARNKARIEEINARRTAEAAE